MKGKDPAAPVGRVHDMVDKLHEMDEVPIPGTLWSVLDWDDLATGDVKLVVRVDGQFCEVRIDPWSSVRVLVNTIEGRLRADRRALKKVGK